MALFKSQVLTQASGSVGGLTYTRTGSGMVIRARSKPINPRSERQQVVRNGVGQLATYWVETLTEEQRTGWNVYAKQTKILNKLGDSISISGISSFIRSNTPRLQAGLSIITAAPTVFDHGKPLISPIFDLGAGPTVVTATLLWSNPATPGGSVLIYLSKQQNPSINFFKGPYQFNVLSSIDTGEQELVLATPPTAGNKLFVRARITYADGRLSPITELEATVPPLAP